MTNEFDILFNPGAGLPGAPLCTCDVVAGLNAALNDQPAPLCPMHDAAAMAERETVTEREEAEARRDIVRDAWNETRAEDDAATVAKAQAVLGKAAMQRRKEADPVALMLADAVGAHDPGQWGSNTNVPIGNDAALMSIVAGALGPGTTVNSFEHPDQPFDAA